MKKTIAMILAAFAFATTAMAGTLNVFAEYIGTGSYASPSQERKDAYAAFLENNDIDFGVFYGPSSSGNFGFSHADYSKSAGSGSSGSAGFHIFVYKKARWTLLKRYDMQTASNKKNSADACVLQDKTTGEQFIFEMPSGTSFPYVNSGSAIAPVTSIKSSCRADYPNARMLVGLSRTRGILNGITTDDKLDDSIIAWGFTEARVGTDGGAIYAQNHEARTALSASSVSWLDNATEPAALATVTYRQEVTIAFQDWDGTPLGEPQTLYVGDDATPPADPTRVGHHFIGWSGSYQNVQASATLVAQYNPDMFTVRFLDWNGELLKSEMVAYGTDATPPEDPVREGWRFLGWSGVYTGITGAVDITALYADASTVTHWVTFKDYDGTELSRQEILDGQDAIPPADPTRAGWHFTGWSGTYTGVTQDEIVTATYAINAYEVTFQDWDGTVLKTQTVAHGSDATPPANPSRMGYHFTGWSGAYQNVQAAATIVAQYEINYYTVRFKHEDGTVLSEQQVAYQAAATAPETPEPLNENRVFYKWSCGYSSITADLEVVAVFVNKVVEIATGAEFAEYMGSSLVSKLGITFALTSDISLSGTSYTKPGDFVATIDGRGHTLSGLSSGFQMMNKLKGKVKNLCISGYRLTANQNRTSVIAGTSEGGTLSGVVMTNCHWTLRTGSHGTSGMIYQTTSSTLITNCTMRNCSVIGIDAGGGGQNIGGFVSIASNVRIVDCHFISDNPDAVSVGGGVHAAGAFVGRCGSNVTIERCSNNAYVSATTKAGSSGGAGGLIGYSISNSGSPTVVDCANFGKVESVDYSAGGMIGDLGTNNVAFAATIKSCYNYGSISSSLAAGGIVGRYRGASKTIVNCGNAGSVSSPTGYAGGIVGCLRYNGNNGAAGFENVFQCGAVSTESGFAGILAGGLSETTGSGLTLAVNNAWMAGSATASAGGKAGLAIGGCDAASTGALALSVSGGGVLNSNASLAAGYNAAGQALEWTAPGSFAPSALVDRTVLDSLNGVARAQNLTRWIPGEEFPELEPFGTEFSPGMILMWW